MILFRHLFLFVLSAGVIWFFAGILIEAVNRVAHRFHKPGFWVAFFVLGFLTSISEISVAFNATLNGTPQISVGNLIGASFVILLFIIPLLAVVGKGVGLRRVLKKGNLLLTLGAVLLPVLFVLDGALTRSEGIFTVLAFGALLYAIKKQGSVQAVVEDVGEAILQKRTATLFDSLKITLGAVAIFLAGHLLVSEAVYFANVFGVPYSLVGLMVLSLGTNVPELVIAARAILKRHKDIAFGDYLGSAATNTLIFGALSLVNGSFTVERSEFVGTFVLMTAGLVLFYFFARSKERISRLEGIVLLFFYICFLSVQIYNFVRFSSM